MKNGKKKIVIENISGWHLIGCPFQVETTFSSEFNSSNCFVVKNFEGFWIPNETTNSIVNFEAGKGYFLNMK